MEVREAADGWGEGRIPLKRQLTESGLRLIEVATFPKVLLLAGALGEGAVYWPVGGWALGPKIVMVFQRFW